MSLPGDPGLPPGCSEWMIEERFGGSDPCPECDDTRELNESDCCGAALHGDYQDQLICPRCNESCERVKCESCVGSNEDVY